MKKRYLISFYLSTTLAAFAAIAIVGCGGGGGPIKSGSSTSTVSPSAAFKALWTSAQQADQKNVGNAKCATCHATEATQLAKTIHASKNVSCENCHGPGDAHANNPSGFQTNILTYAYGSETASVTSYIVCNQCHGVQEGQWASSLHSQVITDALGSLSTTCFRCHSGDFHAQYIDTPLSQGQSATQVNTTIVGLSSAQMTTASNCTGATAQCVVCHDPHQNTAYMAANTSTNGGQYMLRRSTSSQDTADIGPGVPVATYTSYNQLCGACHNARAADPEDGSIKPKLGLRGNTSRPPNDMGPQMNMLLATSGVVMNDKGAQVPPGESSHGDQTADQCVTCHMPSASHVFAPQFDTSCSPCHSASDASARQSALQSEILADLNQIQSTLTSWSESKFGASHPDFWDYTTNITTGTPPAQDDTTIPIEVKRARYNYYFVVNDGSYGVHSAFYSEFLLGIANDNLNELLGTNNPLVGKSNIPTAQLKAYFNSKAARAKAHSCVVTPRQSHQTTSTRSTAFSTTQHSNSTWRWK